MRDYAEQVKRLREATGWRNASEHYALMHEAADAIEELLAAVKENDWRICENCSLQHFDSDGLRWCTELSMVVGGAFYCGYFEGSEPPKEDAEC